MCWGADGGGVWQGGRAESDDEDEGQKVSRKKGLAAGLFGDDDDAGGEAAAAAAAAPSRRRTGYDVDSDDSMADFIEDDDDEAPPEGGEGAARRPRERPRRRARRGPNVDDKIKDADAMFGEDEYDDEYPDEEDEEAPTVGINDMYEPAVIQEFFLSDSDVEIRKTDLPERLQLDMEGRGIVSTLEDVRAEARWMVNVSKDVQWRNSSHMDDSGEEIVEMLNPKGVSDDDDKKYLRVTRTERAKIYRESLIEKVSNVLCYLRGIDNEEIHHGGNFIVSKDNPRAGVPNWWQAGEDEEADYPDDIGSMKAVFDIPFIQHYRKEYYEPDLRPEDLWAIHDLDAKYCSILSRQSQLSTVFREKEDAEGVQLCRNAASEEGLADIKALIDLKYPAAGGSGGGETAKGRKMPVRVSRHKQCADAGLGKLVAKFCISPKHLCHNLEGTKKHHPEDPADEPIAYACDFVVQAERYGFREATHVLDGARQMAAKELANDPNLRRYVRYDFDKYSVVKVSLTQAGENSLEEYHREFTRYYSEPLREIGLESFLWMMKAYKENLLTVDIELPRDRQDKLMGDLMRYYKSDHNNPSADLWNEQRSKIMVEALEKHLYPVLALGVAQARITKAKKMVGSGVMSKLEELLRVPPYKFQQAAQRGEDGKRVAPERIMACCFSEPAEFVVIDKRGEVLAFKSVYLRVSRNHSNMEANFHENEYKSLRNFFEEQTPGSSPRPPPCPSLNPDPKPAIDVVVSLMRAHIKARIGMHI